jgi:dihydroorotase
MTANGGILIKDGRVIDPSRNIDGMMDILVRDGVIAAIGPGLKDKAEKIVNVRGLVVAPGFVDMHVHLREPGQEGKETIATGTRAAALGGVTSLACMPNTVPPLDTASQIAYVLSRAAVDGVVRVYPIGCISAERKGELMADLTAMKEAGAVAFSDDGDSVMNALLVRRAMINLAGLGSPYIEHAEDANLIDGGVMNDGLVSLRLGLAGRTTLAEDVIVSRDLLLAAAAGAHLHVAHITSPVSIGMVRDAKQGGGKVTCEATPHHLALTDADIGEYDTLMKVNPPLRNEIQRKALVAAVADGTVDAIASDHAPHGPLDKDVEFNLAASGVIGLETMLPVCLMTLVGSGAIGLPVLVKLMSTSPARILGIAGGTLAVDAPADITVFDEKAEWVLDVRKLASKSRNSPFNGRTMRGRVVHTLVGGALVVKDGALCE